MTNNTNQMNIRIDSTDSTGVTLSGAVTVRLAWADLLAAARQPDASLGAAYADAMERAIGIEADRIGRLPVRVVGSVVDPTNTNVTWVADVDLMAGGYSIDTHDPRAHRGPTEGGTLPTRALAEAELADRLARIATMAPPVKSRTAAQVATREQLRQAVAARHGMVGAVGGIEIRR